MMRQDETQIMGAKQQAQQDEMQVVGAEQQPQQDKLQRMKELNRILMEASRAYYHSGEEIMPNITYDKLYDELEKLEAETGIVMNTSPTHTVEYEVASALEKERHEAPMLSLDKTKERAVLADFVGSHKSLLSWKLDGLTVVLTYRDGKLFKAVTRGNGEIGEVITANAKVFKNLPLSIPFKGELILRGEAVITYPDFDRMNEQIPDEQAKYKNPRNLCSGSVRQLSSQITAERNVRFYAFGLVRAEDVDFKNSRQEQLMWLTGQGFDVVEYMVVTRDNLEEAIDRFAKKVETFEVPSDGLVVLYDDIAYGESLGRTAKFPRNAFAFKWKDELQDTRLLEIEWSASRTGLLNPVAIFEPVELEGTTVSRASVHNVSIVKNLKLGIGDVISVYKANMIIPQIAENKTGSASVIIPEKCPVCGMPTTISVSSDVETLLCTNPDCLAKKIKQLGLFVGRDGLDIEGMSEATLEKWIDAGLIHQITDLFHLDRHRDVIVQMEGFGEKSCAKLLESVEKARHTTLPRLLYSLGITGIGTANAKMLCQAFGYDLEKIRTATAEELALIEGIGPVLADSIEQFFKDDEKKALVDALLAELTIEVPAAGSGSALQDAAGENAIAGKTFVVTGSVFHFENRNKLKEFIEDRGGKVTGSVSAKTHYLINNDDTSASSKNKKAKELGIPILTEEAFLELAGEK